MYVKEIERRERICLAIAGEMVKNYNGDLIGFMGVKREIERMLLRVEKQMRSKNKIDINELRSTIY